MKTLRLILIPFLIAAFVLAGCGRTASGPEFEDLSKLPDLDGDGIPNKYDHPDNEKDKDIACYEDGDYDKDPIYLPCDETADCNCNGIDDATEMETTEDCGWACVKTTEEVKKKKSNGGGREAIMIGTGLVGAFMIGAIVFAKGPKNDVNGLPVDYFSLKEDEGIDWDNSYIELVKTEGNEEYMEVHVEGCCVSDSVPEGFECSADIRNQIDDKPTVPVTIPQTGVKGDFEYSYDMDESPAKGKFNQYIKIWDSQSDESVYVYDPSWIGLKPPALGGNKSVTELWDKVHYADGEGDFWFYEMLAFGADKEEAIEFQLNPILPRLPERDVFYFYKWHRVHTTHVYGKIPK